MEDTLVQSIKLAIVAATGLSKDALHIYMGLAVLFSTAALLRRPLHSRAPWLAVAAVAVAGELVDFANEMIHLGHWDWATSLRDIANTLFWPTLLCLSARHVSFFWMATEP